MESFRTLVTVIIVAQIELHKEGGKSHITTKKNNCKMKIKTESNDIPEYPRNRNCRETCTNR